VELSVQGFLDSVSNKSTRKGYRFGINKFVEWFGKAAEEILSTRQEDLTQKAGENLIEYRNRAARFQKEIERFHSYLIETGYSINSARNMTVGIRQLFRYYQMPVIMRSGSRVSQTVQTTKNFPLTIEHVRKMFKVANLKERIILSLAVDTGLRISDFIAIKKVDLSSLDEEPPIAFDLLTQKEKIIAHCFLSQESVDLLKTYLPTLQKKNSDYLFASKAKSHISDEAINKMLRRLAKKAQINLNGKKLTFHCFRKMFLSSSIDSGIGLTAGKLMCGKAVPKSDSTYLTTIKLRDHFIQLKRFLGIKEQIKIETEKIETFKKAINKLQDNLTIQDLITKTISEENLKLKSEIEDLKKGQSGLEEKVDEMTNLFRTTFRDLTKTTAETIVARAQNESTNQ
jgi:integrase